MLRKKFALIIMILGFIAGTSVGSFAQNNKKVEKARDKAEKAEQQKDEIEAENKVEAAEAKADKEWQEYKQKAENKIAKNEARIEELRSHQTNDPSRQRKHYEKINKLEAENREIRNELNAYQYDNKDGWRNFKKKLDRKLDKLERDLEDVMS